MLEAAQLFRADPVGDRPVGGLRGRRRGVHDRRTGRSPSHLPWWLAILGGLVATGAIGYLQGSLITRLHIPSFVATLAGLLFFEGVIIELATIDKQAVGGVMSVAQTSVINKPVDSNISVGVSWILLVVVLAICAALALMGINAAGQFMATAIVLLMAAAVDALVRRRGASEL